VSDPADGALWVADQYNHQIRRVAFVPPAGGDASTLAGRANATAGFAEGVGTNAAFSEPWGLALAPSGGGLFVADHLNHRLRYVALPSAAVSTLAGTGTASFANGAGALAAFNLPRGIALSSDGAAVYVADFSNVRVRRYSAATGRVDTVAGTGAAAFASGGAGAALTAPQALALHPQLGLLIGEAGSSCALLAFNLSSAVLTPLVGPTRFHCFSALGPSSLARFNYPAAILVGRDNATIFVGDHYSHAWVTVTGCGGSGGGGDGSGGNSAGSPSPSPSAPPLPPPAGACALTTLASGAPLVSPQDVAPAPGGGAFVTDAPGALRRVFPNRSVVTLSGGGGAGFADGAPGAAAFNFSVPGGNAMAGLALAAGAGPAGALLIADSGNCRLRALSLDTLLATTLAGSGACGFADGPPALAAFALPSGVALSPALQLLFVSDTFNHRIRVLPLALSPAAPAAAAGGVATLSGTGAAGGADGPAGAASFVFPRGVAAQGGGGGGSVYVTEASHRVRAVRMADGWTTTLAGAGTAGFADSFLAAVGALFNAPWLLGLDEFGGEGGGDGLLLIADSANHRLRGVALGAGGAATTVAGSGAGAPPFYGDGGAARSAALIAPRSAKPAGGGAYLVVEGGAAAAVRVLLCGGGGAGASASPSPGAPAPPTPTATPTPSASAPPSPTASPGAAPAAFALTTLVGSNATGGASANGVGAAAALTDPVGIVRSVARDGRGLLLAAPLFYVADGGAHAVRALNASNATLSTFAGALGVPGFADGPALGGALFRGPTGVAVNATGAVFVTDTLNHAVRVIVRGVVTTVGGSGAAGYAEGTGTAARFNGPAGVSADSGMQTAVFVCDVFNHVIRKLAVPSLAWESYAGNGSAGVSANGPLNAVRLNLPRGVARVELSNRLYVADTGNGRIVVINTHLGTAATLVGGGLNGRLSADFGGGPGALTSLWTPEGLLVGDGSPPVLFVASSGSRVVQSVELSSGNSVLLAGSGVGAPGGGADGWTGAGGGARLGSPRGLAQDPASGALLVVDGAMNGGSAGAVRRVALPQPPQCSTTTSVMGGGALINPTGVAWKDGNIYVAEEHAVAARVRLVLPNGTTAALGPANGCAPTGVAPTDGGAIVTCFGQHRVGLLFGNGTFVFLAGNSTPGYADGAGPSTMFFNPFVFFQRPNYPRNNPKPTTPNPTKQVRCCVFFIGARLFPQRQRPGGGL
jgi:sugar lactone lactonase YvrE